MSVKNGKFCGQKISQAREKSYRSNENVAIWQKNVQLVKSLS